MQLLIRRNPAIGRRVCGLDEMGSSQVRQPCVTLFRHDVHQDLLPRRGASFKPRVNRPLASPKGGDEPLPRRTKYEASKGREPQNIEYRTMNGKVRKVFPASSLHHSNSGLSGFCPRSTGPGAARPRAATYYPSGIGLKSSPVYRVGPPRAAAISVSRNLDTVSQEAGGAPRSGPLVEKGGFIWPKSGRHFTSARIDALFPV